VVKLSVCSCCGHPLPESGPREALTGMQKRMFDIVLRSGTAGISGPELMNRLYEGNPNGGPDSLNIVAVMAHAMRKQIEEFGISIVSTRGPGGTYRIVPMYKKQEASEGLHPITKWRKRRRQKALERLNA
jgi:hypothetical protein